MGHSRPLFLYFYLFNTVDSKQTFGKFCRWLDSNRGSPLVSEATALPTEPQPLIWLIFDLMLKQWEKDHFWFIFVAGLHKNDSTFILKFVTHQSKVLEEYHVNVAQKIDSIPKKLKDFCDASLSLCYGIDVHQKFVDCVFVEVFNDVISVRSRKCLFVTSSPNLPCSECLKLKLLTGLTHVKGV